MSRLAATCCVLLLGCGSSPPAEFFTLDAVRPVPAAAAAAGPPIRVAAVHIPPALDRQEMVGETTADRLAISDRHRWAAPLSDMVRRVLTQDLADRLPKGMVRYPEEPIAPDVHDVVLDILEFGRTASGAVQLDASWSLLPATSDSVIVSRHVRLSDETGGAGFAGQARSMSRIVGRLADEIAATVSAIRPHGPA